MHRLVTSTATNLIELTLSGFLSPADVQALQVEFASIFFNGRAKPDYLLLVDIVHLPAQSQESVATFVHMIAQMPKAKRIAMIGGSSITRMQLGRVMQQPCLRSVSDRASALAWLTRELEPAQAGCDQPMFVTSPDHRPDARL